MSRKILFLAIAILTCALASAQTRTVTGTVISADDRQPLIGAYVAVSGTPEGVITDTDGTFSIEVPESAQTLTVTFFGMKDRTVRIEDRMEIVMETDTQDLDEVMVVAYGTAKKESFTGSAEVVSSEKIGKRPVANVTKALDGLVAGVQTTSGSGQPGSGVSVVIRGFGSINAATSPLYVVDGIPYDGDIASISPGDIESMTVLKDASAGALYGSRGANGVVMITTKKGNDGKARVNLKANWGIASRAIPRYETMYERSWIETIYQSYRNDLILEDGMLPSVAASQALEAMKSGPKAIFGVEEQYNPFNYSITSLIDPSTGKVRGDAVLKYSEDWMDEVMESLPLRQEYSISVSGGIAKTKYMFSFGYLDEEGLLKTTDFRRLNGRMNIESKVTDWLKASMSASYSRNESNSAVENSIGNSNIWYTAQLMGPVYPVYEKDAAGHTLTDASGNKIFDYGSARPAGAIANWNSIATLYDDKYSSASDNLSGRMALELGNLEDGPLKGLKFSVNYGFDLVNSAGMTYYNPYNGNATGVSGQLEKSTVRTFSYTLNQLLGYDRSFGEHNLSVLAGHEFYKYNRQYLGASKTGFPFGGFYELDVATNILDASSSQDNYAVESVLSRLEYDYADTYYLSASFRTDGSSRFHRDSRWGNFWSVGANWRISQEKFMSGLSWLNNLSLKASYGVQGNDNLNTYYAWQSFYSLSYPNANMSGMVLSSLENKDLRWEKNGNFNVGIEGRFLNRISLGVEWYSRRTSDMLMTAPMAMSTGFDGYDTNIGSMVNKGWDITLAGDIFSGERFGWRLTLMGSTIKNKVLKLSDKSEIISGNYIIREGETLNSFYTATSAGVDPATGEQLFWVWDTDAEGRRGERYVTSDQVKAGTCKEIQGSRIPALYGSFNNEFRIGNFDLGILFTYSIGGKILDSVYRTLMYGTYVGTARSTHLGRAWKNPGDVTDIPRIQIGKTYTVTDNDLVNASYLSLKNVTLGYTLPEKWMKAARLSSVRLTLTGDNLFILTHLKGMDPQYDFTGGTNYGYVPVRTVSLGIDVTF